MILMYSPDETDAHGLRGGKFVGMGLVYDDKSCVSRGYFLFTCLDIFAAVCTI